MTLTPPSPYARALGERIHDLHPTLQSYFSAIPVGSVGIGEGTFSHVGTPRRWLWPVLQVLQRRGVIAACWETDIPFVVRNRSVGQQTTGEREFQLPQGTWTMRDAVAPASDGYVTDTLGMPGTVAAVFAVAVHDGILTLTSTKVGIRWGKIRLRLPRRLSPVVRVSERYDDDLARQRVTLTIDAPVIGRVYEYAGDFTYQIAKETL